ncbi:MAG TPA: PQQ-binding-like beta-propeller repeat protein [bacterium]|jgi:outer membrane protein assembly factor BamB
MRFYTSLSISIILMALISCGSGNSPVVPESGTPGLSTIHDTSNTPFESPGHQILGMWELYFDTENMTAEAVPHRLASGHFNVRKFMEVSPCSTCLTLLNFQLQPDHTFFIDVEFEHPFAGLDQFTGFDVRGVPIFNGSYNFPASKDVMSDSMLGDMELLNADGYTRLFNPVEFPEGSDLPLWTYTKGKKATLLQNPATINGYKSYFPDSERRIFLSGDVDIQTYHIAWPTGTKLRVGYVVDASWSYPSVFPVVNPQTDFPPNANSIEPYAISATIGEGLQPGCGIAPFEVWVYDHQGADTVTDIFMEAPELFTGILSFSDKTDMGYYVKFTGSVPNELEVPQGSYRVLIGANDITPDPKLGALAAYQLVWADVAPQAIDYNDGWRKHGRTLDNHNDNVNETDIVPAGLSEEWSHQFELFAPPYLFDSTPTHGPFGVYVEVDIPFAQEIWQFDPVTGTKGWHRVIKLTPDAYLYSSTATVGNCELYVGGSSVFSFDAEDGDNLWSYDNVQVEFVDGGAVVIDGVAVMWGNNNTLYGMDSISGDEKWNYTTGEDQFTPGTPAYEDGVVYGSDGNGFVFAVNIQDGSELWKTTEFADGGPLSFNSFTSNPVIAGGLLWAGCNNAHLYGIDMSDGSVIKDVPLTDRLPWKGPASDGTFIYQPVTFHPVYVGDFTGPFGVMAIDMNGDVQWEFNTADMNEGFFSSPVVANGYVWVATDHGSIYALDPSMGDPDPASPFMLDNPTTAGMSIVNGRLYIMDRQGKFYCLGNN